MSAKALNLLSEKFPSKIIAYNCKQLRNHMEKEGLLNDIEVGQFFYQKEEVIEKMLKANGFIVHNDKNNTGSEGTRIVVATPPVTKVKATQLDYDSFDLSSILSSDSFQHERENVEIQKDYTENTEMISSYQKKPTSKLLEDICRLNEGLVDKVAQFFKPWLSRTSLTYEDLKGAGYLGLLKAIEKYDPTKGYQFSTYAVWWIRQRIHRDILDNGYMVRLPVHMHELLQRVRKVEKKYLFSQEENKIEKICDELKITRERYYELKRYDEYYLHNTSYDAIIGEDGSTALVDLLPAEANVLVEYGEEIFNPEEEVLKNLYREEIIQLINSLCTKKEADVLYRRNGFDTGQVETLEEIGQTYHVTRERIRQIEAKAMEKLKEKVLEI